MFYRLLIAAFVLSTTVHAQSESPLSGEVVNADDGQPIEGAHVVLEGTDFHWFTEGEGAFSFPALPAGTYNITVTADGYQTFRDRVEVAEASGAPIKLEVRLNRELAQSGRTQGLPAPGPPGTVVEPEGPDEGHQTDAAEGARQGGGDVAQGVRRRLGLSAGGSGGERDAKDEGRQDGGGFLHAGSFSCCGGSGIRDSSASAAR